MISDPGRCFRCGQKHDPFKHHGHSIVVELVKNYTPSELAKLTEELKEQARKLGYELKDSEIATRVELERQRMNRKPFGKPEQQQRKRKRQQRRNSQRQNRKKRKK